MRANRFELRRPDKTDDGDDVIITMLVKGDERYVWCYTEQQRADVRASLGRFAANPELSFTWYDAALLAQRVRGKAEDAKCHGKAADAQCGGRG